MATIKVNEKGQVIVTLPSSGVTCKFREPKGKDLKAVELAASSEGASNTGTMMLLASLLMVEPTMTYEEVEDLSLDDVMEVGIALTNFRAFARMAAK